MKKAFLVFLTIASVTGCANNDNTGTGSGPRSTDADTAASNIHVVENANGNMPDTANSINIGTDTKTTTDTARH